MSKKLPGWEKRLTEVMADSVGRPFRPGRLDCGVLFGDSYRAMTGIDIFEPFRGNYKTIAGAMEIARGLGFDDHIGYISSLLIQRPSPLHGQRGDGAVVIDIDGVEALGIIQGEGIYVMGLKGLTITPLTSAVKAFEI